MSERNYEDECGDHGGNNSAGDPCGRPAGWGTDFDSGKCRHHRGTSPDGSSHKGNENAATHYAFSDKFRDDLTDPEDAALNAFMKHLNSITDERTLAAEVAGEALLKYKRTGDQRFLREARQWMSEFNLLPNEEEVSLSGGLNVSSEFATLTNGDDSA